MKKMSKKLMSLLLVLVLVCAALTACGSKEEAPAGGTDAPQTQPATEGAAGTTNTESEKPAELKLALVGPMTGDSAQYGLQFERGVKEAVDAYNAKGGTQVTVDVFDDKNDAKEAVSLANKIVADGGYAGIIGPFSSTCALAMAEVTDEEKMITISPSCSHPDYVKLYDYTFRLSHVNSYEGEMAATYMKDTFGSTKVAGIFSNNDWGIAVNDAFVAKAKELGLEVVADESFIIGQTKDFSSIITKIKQSGAESVYYMGQYTECAAVLKQIQDMGLDVKELITTSSYKVESLQLAGASADEAVFMTAFFEDPSNARVADFSKLVKEKYDVALDNFILRAYDATDWFLQGFDKCGSTDPDTLRQGIIDVGTAGFDGIGGSFTLNAERNVDRVFLFCKSNGKHSGDEAFELLP